MDTSTLSEVYIKEEPVFNNGERETNEIPNVMRRNSCLQRLPILHSEPGVDVPLSGYELFVFDTLSWHCLRKLLMLVEDAKNCCELIHGCVFLGFDELRPALTLHQHYLMHGQSGKHFSGTTQRKFHWCHVKEEFKQTLQAYALCRGLHLGSINCILSRRGRPKCNQVLPSNVTLALVMKAQEILDSFTSHTKHIILDHVVRIDRGCPCVNEFTKNSEKEIQMMTSSQKVDRRIRTVPFGFNVSKEGLLPADCSTSIVDSSTTSEATHYSPSGHINIEEMDLQCYKLEQDADAIEDSGGKGPHLQQVQRSTHMASTGDAMMVEFNKLVSMSREFSDLFRNRGHGHVSNALSSNYRQKMSIILECPNCDLPGTFSSPSALGILLRHVSKRHPQQMTEVVADIIEQYAPFINYMKERIQRRKKRMFMKKLRKVRKNCMTK